MIVQQTHRVNEADAALPVAANVPTTSHAAEIASAAMQARVLMADQSRERSGRKLRNRLILANAVAWVGIIVAVRMLFF